MNAETVEYCIAYAKRHGCMVTSEASKELAAIESALRDTLLALRECVKHVDMVHIAELDMAERAEAAACR